MMHARGFACARFPPQAGGPEEARTMGQDLPARTFLNGPKTGETGRDARGRFVPGNPGGGRPANPFARQQAQLRQTVLDEVNEADLRAVVRKVLRLAKLGNLAAV